MAEDRVPQSTPRAQIKVWEKEAEVLRAKLRSAVPLQKIQYYEELKAVQAKIAAARGGKRK